MTTFHDFTKTSITGDSIDLSTFSGSACLVVNVASKCGLTPQYEGLQALHHKVDDLQVLGFPCNQFAEQEPGTEAEILECVQSNFAVDFPMFAKLEVNGDGADDLYQWLKAEQPGDGASSDISWNFEKFLINAAGEVVARFAPLTTPEEIEEQLGSYL